MRATIVIYTRLCCISLPSSSLPKVDKDEEPPHGSVTPALRHAMILLSLCSCLIHSRSSRALEPALAIAGNDGGQV